MAESVLTEKRLLPLIEQYKQEFRDICWNLFESKFKALDAFTKEIVECKYCRNEARPGYAALRDARSEAVAAEARFVLDTPEVESTIADIKWRTFRNKLHEHIMWYACSRHQDAAAKVKECAELCKRSRSIIIDSRILAEKAEQYGIERVLINDFEEADSVGERVLNTIKVNIHVMMFPILALAPTAH